MFNASSCGSLPRNRKQVANIKYALKPKCSEKDPLFAVMEQCKREESQIEPFIRNVQGAPEAMCVLASDSQLRDVARFCCDSQLFSVFGVDPTFNLGEFMSLSQLTVIYSCLTETRRTPLYFLVLC